MSEVDEMIEMYHFLRFNHLANPNLEDIPDGAKYKAIERYSLGVQGDLRRIKD